MLTKWRSNKIFTSFSVLASGSIFAQLLSILVSPVTTRLFTPNEFGYYTIIYTAITLFGPVISLKYDMAIMTAKTVKETNALIKLSVFLALIFSAVISFFYGVIVLDVESEKELITYMVLIFLLLFLYGVNNVLLAHNNKSSFYKLISLVTVVKSSINNLALIVSGFLGFGVLGLVCSQLLSSIIGIKVQSKGVIKELHLIKSITFLEIKNVALKFKNQPIYNASSALINTAVYSLINLFVFTFYSAYQLGLYSISYRVLGIPFAVVSANIARVFFEKATFEKNDKGNYSNTFKSVLKLLCLTVLPFIFFLGISAPSLFSLIFGDNWEAAGYYVRLLAPMFAIKLIAESLTTSFIVSGKQRFELAFQIALILGEVIVFAVVFMNDLNIETFLILISLLYLIVQGTMVMFMYNLSKENSV